MIYYRNIKIFKLQIIFYAFDPSVSLFGCIIFSFNITFLFAFLIAYLYILFVALMSSISSYWRFNVLMTLIGKPALASAGASYAWLYIGVVELIPSPGG